MLINMYGDFMELPPAEKRKTHYPYKLSFSGGENPGYKVRRREKYDNK